MGKDAVPDGRAGPELPPWPGESGPGTDRAHSWTRSTPLEGADATSGLRKGQGRTGYFLWNSLGRERKSSNSTSGPAFCMLVLLGSACWSSMVLRAGVFRICMLVLQSSACRCSWDLHAGAAGLCMQVFLGSACWLVLQGSACWCYGTLHAGVPGLCCLQLPTPSLPGTRALPREKMQSLLQPCSPAEEGQPLGVWSPQDSSDEARSREGQPEQF